MMNNYMEKIGSLPCLFIDFLGSTCLGVSVRRESELTVNFQG